MKKVLLFLLICLRALPFIAQDSVDVRNNTAVVDAISENQGNNELSVPRAKRPQRRDHRSRAGTQPLHVVPYGSIKCRDSVLFSKVEGAMAEMSEKVETTIERLGTYEKQIVTLQSHLANIYNIMRAVLIILIVCVIFAVVAFFMLRHQNFKETSFIPEDNVDEPKHDNPVISSTIVEDEVPPLSDADVVAYNNAIQAFVNINNYIYDLKKHNTLITPYMMWIVSDCPKPNVDTTSVSDEERSKVALLASQIEQFKNNYEQAIRRYLIRSKNVETFEDCIRCPLYGTFNPELDQHLLGQDLEKGEKIRSVYKMGFHFPGSKAYPYREKSLIL